jgi:hypothetical protein
MKMERKVDYIHIDPFLNDGMKLMLLRPQSYWSPRYKKIIAAEPGFKWDGATGAVDLEGSKSHLMHDVLCNNATWTDGTPVSNWQASQVLKDILKQEGYKFRQYTWRWATFLGGGWKIKALNGWFSSWKS